MWRALLHADLDAFYAAVEQRDNPALQGTPLVVGGAADERGVVAAASYEARAFGIRSAQPMHHALRRCPQIVRVSPRFDRYREVSRQVFDIYRAWTPLVEPLSLDEAYLDITAAVPDVTVDALRAAAAALKRQVREATGLNVSVGGGTSKSVAKIASDVQKPDGLVVVPPGAERDFLWPLPITRLWGVGPKAETRLRAVGVTTVGDLAALDRRWIERRFGRWGAMLHEFACGIDGRPVSPEHEAKSISRETTFATDVSDGAQLRETLRDLSESVATSLNQHALVGRTVSIKLRDASFTTINRQVTLTAAAHDSETILAAAARLLDAEVRPTRRFRLLGVGVSGFVDEHQLALL